MADILSKLNKALKSASHAPTGHFRHENEEAIIDAATKLLSKSETGAELLGFARDHNLTIKVLRNKQDFGFFPDGSSVYISCPAGQSMPTARAVIHLAGALREAMQDIEAAAYRRPQTNMPVQRYAQLSADRKKDQLLWQSAVVHELREETGLLEIVDEFAAMGYAHLYEAYKADLNDQNAL